MAMSLFMSLKSSFGSTPCVSKVHRRPARCRRLPVRWPSPNKRAFDAIRARQQAQAPLAAVPVPRSLCVCRLMMSDSRFLMCVQIHFDLIGIERSGLRPRRCRAG